jgi:hypothetical protein
MFHLALESQIVTTVTSTVWHQAVGHAGALIGQKGYGNEVTLLGSLAAA